MSLSVVFFTIMQLPAIMLPPPTHTTPGWGQKVIRFFSSEIDPDVYQGLTLESVLHCVLDSLVVQGLTIQYMKGMYTV